MKIVPNQYKVRIFAFLEEKTCSSQQEIAKYVDQSREKYKDREIENHIREVYE